MTAHKLVLLLICLSGPAVAQDLMRSVEMPAHRALNRAAGRRTSDTV